MMLIQLAEQRTPFPKVEQTFESMFEVGLDSLKGGI